MVGVRVAVVVTVTLLERVSLRVGVADNSKVKVLAVALSESAVENDKRVRLVDADTVVVMVLCALADSKDTVIS